MTATSSPIPTVAVTQTLIARVPICVDWRDGQDHGWKKAAWTGAGVAIQFSKQGMYAVASQNGEWGGVAWWQMGAKDSPPPGDASPYRVRYTVSGGDPSRIYVWQAADDPDNDANVEKLKPDSDGYYKVTKPYVGLGWPLPTPPPQAGPVVIQTFCYQYAGPQLVSASKQGQAETCIDWRDGQDHGWKKAVWSGGGVGIQFTKQGLYEAANQNGEWNGAAWWQMVAKDSPPPGPSAPYRVRFTSNSFLSSRIYVWQAADDPDNNVNVEKLKPDSSGYYTVTKPYVGLGWPLPTPTPQAGPITFYSFCYQATGPQLTSVSNRGKSETCIDWRDGQDHGWKKAAWTGGGIAIQFSKQGMYAVANQNGEWGGAAWWQMVAKDSPPPGPSTPYRVHFTSNGFLSSSIYVWQAVDNPDDGAKVEQLKPDIDGYYMVTKPYVGLRWSLPTPTPPAGPVIVQTFCYSMNAIL